MDYPLFIPPGELSTHDRLDWSLSQARAYRDWLLSSLHERVAYLLAIAEAFERDPSARLTTLGEWVARQLLMDDFSGLDQGQRKLNNHGYALAADAGLAVVRELTDQYAGIGWEIVRRPRRDMSYNLPVLTGFRNNMYLEPVGGSIAEAHGVLRGVRDGTAWLKIYEYWAQTADSG